MTAATLFPLEGGCHCGAGKIRFVSSRPPHALVPRADQCSFCRKHNAAVVSDPDGQLEILISQQAGAPYRFGLHITDFHICGHCGVFVAASWSDAQQRRGVVNIHALVDRASLSHAQVAVDFDGEDIAAREARRRRHWTPARVLHQPDRM